MLVQNDFQATKSYQFILITFGVWFLMAFLLQEVLFLEPTSDFGEKHHVWWFAIVMQFIAQKQVGSPFIREVPFWTACFKYRKRLYMVIQFPFYI